MGSETYEDERPIHTVFLDAFWIDQTEVTNKMYSLCVEAEICEKPTVTSSYTHTTGYYGKPEYDNYPVIYVDWTMARTYCEWAGRRLPTEAEWEKAARGLDGRTYPWGEQISCSLANYWGKDGGCVGDTTEVGSYKDGASLYGALDMAGNVWEWVNDWYDANYYKTLGENARNPQGPDPSEYRVLRGGALNKNNDSARSANRTQSEPAHTDGYAGFRCAMSATP